MITAIDNFLKMSPEVPQYTPRNQHYLIAGANPTYYLEETGSQEEQVAPLAASLDWIQVSGAALDGDVVHMVASTEGTYAIYFVTDTCHVYAATPSGITDMGRPLGVSFANVGARLSCANNLLIFTCSSQNQIKKMSLPGPGAWTNFASTVSTTSGIHFTEPFLDYVAVTDGTSNTNNLVKKADVTSFLVSTGIDIGAGWGVVQMRNYNNKYLAIAAGQTNTTNFVYGYVQNYIFLWDGISDRYNYSVKVPGRYIDMKVIDGVLYVAVLTSSAKTVLYKMTGTRLVKVRTPQLSSISQGPSPVPSPLFSYNNNVGIHLSSFFGVTSVSDPLLVIGNDEPGSSEFVLSHGRPFEQFTIGFDGLLYGNVITASSSIWYYPVSPSSYQPIKYISHWIPVQNAAAIDVYYDTPPQSVTDRISTTIFGRGEDIQSGSSTTTLEDITASTFLNTTRTRLDLKGFTGDKMKVLIETSNTGSWRPIIRQFVILDDRIKT